MPEGQQEAGFEVLCGATDCKHNDLHMGCLIHTIKNPVVLKEGGLCKQYEKK